MVRSEGGIDVFLKKLLPPFYQCSPGESGVVQAVREGFGFDAGNGGLAHPHRQDVLNRSAHQVAGEQILQLGGDSRWRSSQGAEKLDSVTVGGVKQSFNPD